MSRNAISMLAFEHLPIHSFHHGDIENGVSFRNLKRFLWTSKPVLIFPIEIYFEQKMDVYYFMTPDIGNKTITGQKGEKILILAEDCSFNVSTWYIWNTIFFRFNKFSTWVCITIEGREEIYLKVMNTKWVVGRLAVSGNSISTSFL